MSKQPDLLYHFTCCDHGMPGIERTGELRPHLHPLLPEIGPVVWLTDIANITHCGANAVGIERTLGTILSCDRTEMRYVVDPARCPGLIRWDEVRGLCNPLVVDDLEEFGWPARWWIARGPVPVLEMA